MAIHLFLPVSLIGEVTAEKVKIVQDADAIYREEIANAGLDREINQYFAALTNMKFCDLKNTRAIRQDRWKPITNGKRNSTPAIPILTPAGASTISTSSSRRAGTHPMIPHWIHL